MNLRSMTAAVVLFVAPWAARGALTGNLINDGDFENNSYLKNSGSLDALGTMIPIQRFNKDADWGLWEGVYGVPSLGGGFSTMNNPRDPSDPRPLTRNGRDVSNFNISQQPENPSNHVMENIMFRPAAGQWIKAPTNQTTGPVSFSFDFFYNAWDPAFFGDFITVSVYGLNFEPQHDIGIMYSPVSGAFDLGPGSFLGPLGTWGNNPTGLDGQVIERFNWGGWFTHNSTNGWKHVSSDDPNSGWTDITPDPGIPAVRNTSISQTFDYYAIVIYCQTYSESSDLFWMSTGEGDLLPNFTMAFDNLDFRMSVANAVLRGDVNLDGLVNALDISPFVTRLTSGAYQAEADINQDNLVNALDISGFVTCLVNGACAGQTGGVVPEPAGGLVLALGALGLLRRR